jgi:hypothetical protein
MELRPGPCTGSVALLDEASNHKLSIPYLLTNRVTAPLEPCDRHRRDARRLGVGPREKVLNSVLRFVVMVAGIVGSCRGHDDTLPEASPVSLPSRR